MNLLRVSRSAGRRLVPGALVLLAGLLAATSPARAQFTPVVEEVEPFSSSGSVLAGSTLGLTGLPTFSVVGHDYDFSLTGPLLLDLGTFLGRDESLLVVRIVPGVKYKFILPEVPFVPYAKAGLAADLLYGDAAGGHSLGLGLRLGGGVRHFIERDLALGAELACTLGSAAGDDETSGSFSVEALIAFEYLLP